LLACLSGLAPLAACAKSFRCLRQSFSVEATLAPMLQRRRDACAKASASAHGGASFSEGAVGRLSVAAYFS